MSILGEPIVGAATSWGTGSDYVAKLLSYQSFQGIAWQTTGGLADSSVFGGPANFTTDVAGLRGAKFSLDAHLLVPQDGLNGLVTFASGDALNISGWEMTLQRPLYDVTTFGKTWQCYKPGLVSWSGSYEGFLDDTAAVNGPLLTAGAAAATFTVVAGGTGKQLAGNIQYSATSGNVKRGGGAGSKSYNFKGIGALTTVGSSTNMLWPADGTGALVSELTAKTLVLTYNTSLALSGTAFWNSIRITNKTGQPVQIQIDGMYSDTVTGFTV
jgi:hypothetical protein